MEEKIEYVICEHAVHQVKPESLRPPALTENFRTYCIVIIYSVFYSVPQRAISVLYRSVYCYILFRYLGFFLQRIQYDNSPVTQKTEITDIHYIIHYGEAETRDHHTFLRNGSNLWEEVPLAVRTLRTSDRSQGDTSTTRTTDSTACRRRGDRAMSFHHHHHRHERREEESEEEFFERLAAIVSDDLEEYSMLDLLRHTGP